MRRAVAAIDVEGVRTRQKRGEPDGRIGVGFAIFCEPVVPGYEPAVARLTTDGNLKIRAGTHSHGQGGVGASRASRGRRDRALIRSARPEGHDEPDHKHSRQKQEQRGLFEPCNRRHGDGHGDAEETNLQR
jgi:Molybdopterin-binding domain of aldehyde dehydrogenase